MQTFIISLKKDVERRERILAQCAKHGIEAEVVDAVYGKELTAEELKQHVEDFDACGMSLPEIGCTLSHMKIYQRMIDENIELALIFEDDAVFKDGIKDIVDDIEEFAKHKTLPYIFLLMQQKRFAINFPIKLQNATLYRYHRGGGAYTYIINKAAAKAYLDCMYPVKLVADDWQYLNLTSDIKIYAVMPYPTIVSEDTVSNLEATRHVKSPKKMAYRRGLFYRNPKALLKSLFYRGFIRLFLRLRRPEQLS